MTWKIGQWREYAEGEIHRTLKQCLQVLATNGFRLEMDVVTERITLDPSAQDGGFFEAVKDYEHRCGVEVLLDVFARGMTIHARSDRGLEVALQIFLRCPEDGEEQVGMFKDIITNRVKQDTLTLC